MVKPVNSDFHKIKTVCLTLGPYRNLTTLNAAIISLHPTCQVLNHASDRILGKCPGKMLTEYSDKNFKRFVEFAVLISGGGKRGRYGGSITLSHAFDHPIVRGKYQSRYGEKLVKEGIECLFWKESMRLTNYIREKNIDLADLILKNSKLKFFMPIRNPLDCTSSNLKSGHSKYFRALVNLSVENLLECIIKEIRWFLDMRKKFPERFFCYVENEFSEGLLKNIAGFLQINADKQWIADSLDCFRLIKPYAYEPSLKNHYHKTLKLYLSKYPLELDKLASLA